MLKRRFKHSLVAVLVAFSLLSQGTWVLAGTTGSISGTVTVKGTAKSTPLSEAKVSVFSPSQTATTTTDAQGHFTFASLAPDTYTLSVEKSGYDSVSVQGVTVLADQNQTYTLNTEKSLSTIVRTRTVAAGDVVSRGTTADLYTVNPAAQEAAASLGGGGALNQAYSAISSVPGVFVPQGQVGTKQSVYVRGGNYTELGYEYDGIPIQRAFDQYPGSSLSSLGQQEVQVYTGAQPADASSDGLAGFVNQVIKTGTYPGFVNFNVGEGSPTFYHQFLAEIGGATKDKSFTYYVGFLGFNQSYRYFDQFNGAADSYLLGTSAYNILAKGCGTPNATAGCYGTGQGPSGYAFGPAVFGFNNIVSDREGLINLHFAIPKKSGIKDDIQLLYDTSWERETYPESVYDWGSNTPDVINGTITQNGVTYPNCATGSTVTGCALLGGNQPTYLDQHFYNGPVGSVLTPGNLGQVVTYLAPNSATNRPLNSLIPQGYPDAADDNASIFKVQYQHNMGSNAYLRAYGYTFYSSWLQNGQNGLPQYFTGSLSPDYELISHTRGVGLTFADQINSQNLINLTGNYTYSGTVRWNNTYYAPAGTNAVLVSSANPTNGICYSATFAPVYCGSGTAARYTVGQAGGTGPFTLQPTSGITVANAGASSCGGAPCEFYTVDSGLTGTYNTVNPAFASVALTDNFRPFDRLLINLGLKYEDFRYNLTDTSTPAGPLVGPVSAGARTLYTNSYNLFHCFSTGTGIIAATSAGVCPTGTSQVAFTNASAPANTYIDYEPRIGATFTVTPNDVLRASYGKYDQPESSAFQQYNRAQNNIAAADAVFYPLGYTSPGHVIPPEISYNTDFSWEHQFANSDVAFKVTPFYRKTDDESITVLLDPKTNFVSGAPLAQETVKGVEFYLKKGDFSRNGLAAQLSFTYTYATNTFNTLSNGGTALDGVNNSIRQYNGYTSYCASHPTDKRCGPTATGQTAAPCYAPDGTAVATCVAGDIANPYWNAPVQSTFDPSASYWAYNQLPGTGLGAVASGFNVPYITSLILNYKVNKLTFTPTFQLGMGGRYGSPVNGIGIAPDLGCTALAPGVGTVANDPRYPYGFPTGATSTANAYDAQTCGGTITAPDAFTGKFDNFGAFTEPSQLVMNMTVKYQVSKNVTFSVTGVNLLDTCFGGSTEQWTGKYSNKIGCWYTSPFYYVGNQYNPGNYQDPAVSSPYSPGFGNVFQQSYGAPANPIELFFNLSVHI